MCYEHFQEAFQRGADVDCIPFPLVRIRRTSRVRLELVVLTPAMEAQLRAAIARVRAKENALQ